MKNITVGIVVGSFDSEAGNIAQQVLDDVRHLNKFPSPVPSSRNIGANEVAFMLYDDQQFKELSATIKNPTYNQLRELYLMALDEGLSIENDNASAGNGFFSYGKEDGALIGVPFGQVTFPANAWLIIAATTAVLGTRKKGSKLWYVGTAAALSNYIGKSFT